jgi:hypothetical protein
MFALLCFVLAVLASPFKSKSLLEVSCVSQVLGFLGSFWGNRVDPYGQYAEPHVNNIALPRMLPTV